MSIERIENWKKYIFFLFKGFKNIFVRLEFISIKRLKFHFIWNQWHMFEGHKWANTEKLGWN